MISLDELERHVMRARQIDRVRGITTACGYALAVHGSMKEERDLDLIAAPWVDDACDAERLIDALSERFGIGDRVPKPHGRLGVVLHGVSGFRYVDLSIMPVCVQDEKEQRNG